MAKKKLTPKEKAIKEEIERLNILFKDLDDNKKNIAIPLIEQIAFLTISIKELQFTINQKGYVETYQNGANQYGVKKSAEVDIHNNMSKLYVAAFKQLIDILPACEEKDELMNFLKGNK